MGFEILFYTENATNNKKEKYCGGDEMRQVREVGFNLTHEYQHMQSTEHCKPVVLNQGPTKGPQQTSTGATAFNKLFIYILN